MSRIETIQLEWFSVDEKLPDDYKTIIARFKDDSGVTIGEYNDGTLEITYDDWHELKDRYKEWCYYLFN